MRLPIIAGWAIQLIGTALWIYGYFVTGHPSLINWHDITPQWFAEWLPNIEAEIGLALVLIGMVPVYWPSRHQRESRNRHQRESRKMADRDPPSRQAVAARRATQFAEQREADRVEPLPRVAH